MIHIFLTSALNEDLSQSECFRMGVTIQGRLLLAPHRTWNCDYKDMCLFM